MKKLIMLSVFGLLTTGMFANNTLVKSSKIKLVEKKQIKKQETTVQWASLTVNCENGNSYVVSCDGCSTSQLVNIARALCE